MASSVRLNLTSEQASLLLPLLQNIASLGNRENRSSAGNVVQLSPIKMSSPNCSTVILNHSLTNSESECDQSEFSLEELTEKKKKNSKSTGAQNYLNVS